MLKTARYVRDNRTHVALLIPLYLCTQNYNDLLACNLEIGIGKNTLQHYLLRFLFPSFTPYVNLSIHTALHHATSYSCLTMLLRSTGITLLHYYYELLPCRFNSHFLLSRGHCNLTCFLFCSSIVSCTLALHMLP